MGGGRQDGAWEHNNQLSWQAEASGLYLASSRPASHPLGWGFLPSREAGADPQKPPTPQEAERDADPQEAATGADRRGTGSQVTW